MTVLLLIFVRWIAGGLLLWFLDWQFNGHLILDQYQMLVLAQVTRKPIADDAHAKSAIWFLSGFNFTILPLYHHLISKVPQ